MKMNWAQSPAAIETLVNMYPDHPSSSIAEIIGCSRYSVKKKAASMGLEKNPDFLAAFCRNLVNCREAAREERDARRIVKLKGGTLPECPSLLDLLTALHGSIKSSSMAAPGRRHCKSKIW